MHMTKHVYGLYSTEPGSVAPPEQGRVQAAVDGEGKRAIRDVYDGAGTVAAYSVVLVFVYAAAEVRGRVWQRLAPARHSLIVRIVAATGAVAGLRARDWLRRAPQLRTEGFDALPGLGIG